MGNQNGIDFHKLNYHPKRVGEWLEVSNWEKAKEVSPIYVEISPTGICNHRCYFCSLDFMGHKNVSLDTAVLKKRISEMAKAGVKSIMFAGEGEPLLHKDMADIAVFTKKSGIDVAFTSNGTVLNEKFCEIALGSVDWIKISVNAGTPDTYSFVHRASKKHFQTVWNNIERAATLRNDNNYSCTIGAQMVLLSENQNEVVKLAELAKSAGCDYLVIKPFSPHPLSIGNQHIKPLIAEDFLSEVEKELNGMNCENFRIIMRRKAFGKLKETRKPYDKCFSVPFFWGYITSEGYFYSCSMFLGDKKFRLGNIHHQSFKQIWKGKRRRKNFLFMKNFDASFCRKGCRMDECNRYLIDVKNPPQHVNFI